MLWPRGLTAVWADPGWSLLQQKAVAAYWGLAVGDALGGTVEFLLPAEIAQRYGRHDCMRGGGWLHLKPGQVTDDTEMALALGEAILGRHGQVDALTVAQRFDAWLHGKPVDVGNTVRRGLVQFRAHGTLEMPEDDYDAGNGACMRTLPVALATWRSDPAVMIRASRTQAHITHNNPLSDAGTECINRMIAIALAQGSRQEMLDGPVADLIRRYPVFQFRRKRLPSNPSPYIVDTLRVVLQVFFDSNSFEECLVEVVNRGGDADTTGAIAGMVAGAFHGLEDIPNRWLRRLDPHIRAACRQQALALMDLSLSGRARH
ncbi:MAG: ADP-ribosyl-[dinitrogen reductase] hydrolase [Magnetococcales bacterium]|nr:ADP-ribosyl-[dinitrogen reductase] hydrolase [Magnetococcales bacterium]